jgi:hypothetical protein
MLADLFLRADIIVYRKRQASARAGKIPGIIDMG